MNKGFSGVSIVLVFFSLIVIISIIFASIVSSAQDRACKGLGYERFVDYGTGPDYCKDYESNLHYVEWGYNKFPNDIWVKEILIIGGVKDENSNK